MTELQGYRMLAGAVVTDALRDLKTAHGRRNAAIFLRSPIGRMWAGWIGLNARAAAEALERQFHRMR
jgi:hypothetical protein